MVRPLHREQLPTSMLEHPCFGYRDARARTDFAVEPWPRPRAFFRGWSVATWLETEPPLGAWEDQPRASIPLRRQPLPLDELSGVLRPFAAEDFWSEVPESIGDRVRRMPSGHLAMLRFASEGDPTRRLVESNPALALMLTPLALSRLLDRDFGFRAEQRAWLASRQHEALGELGFPRTRAMRRLLSRIEPEALTIGRLLELRNAIDEDVFVTMGLAHVRRVGVGVLSLVSDPELRGHVGRELTAEVARDDREAGRDRVACLLRECLRLQKNLGIDRLAGGPRTVLELERLHDELTDAVREQRRARQRPPRRPRPRGPRAQAVEQPRLPLPNLPRPVDPLPPDHEVAPPPPPMEVPPFVVEPLWRSYTERRPATRFGRGGYPETDRIRLVKTAADLNRWARRFRNCSRGYLQPMRSGHYLIYVHAPRSVMIGLRRQGRASWRLDQMVGVQNTAISDAVAVEIITWLLEVGVEVPDEVLRRYRPH